MVIGFITFFLNHSALASFAQHTRNPLLPAALASVPFGFVLVRVRVHSSCSTLLGDKFSRFESKHQIKHSLLGWARRARGLKICVVSIFLTRFGYSAPKYA